MNDEQRRTELARFLRARRACLTPQQVGLPQGGRRRTPGLRREEVAALAGVGTSWYTWLEQGRSITATASVLDGLARVLRLDAVERAHLFILARGEVPASAPQATEQVGPAVQQILDALGAYPAYVANARWDVLAWNEAACHIFTDFAALPPRERNLLRFLFTHPLSRHLYVDWVSAAQRTLALVRASAGPYLGEPWFAALVEELSNASPEFAAWWPCGDVCGIPEGGKELNHPVLGRLALQATPLQVAQAPDLWMIVYTPLPGTQTDVKLQHVLRSRLDSTSSSPSTQEIGSREPLGPAVIS